MTRSPKKKGRGRPKKFNKVLEIPATEDPRWELWSRPLYEFLLSGPRQTHAIVEWADDIKIGQEYMHELLGWLSLNDRAESFDVEVPGHSPIKYWRALRPLSKKVIPRYPPVPKCTVCSGILRTDDWTEWRCCLCARMYYHNL